MKLTTHAGEIFFNSHLISHVHLSADHSLLTVHFVNGTAFGLSTETDVASESVAEFLGQLAGENSGFVATGSELLNLKSALWIAIPNDAPVQIRSSDNRLRSFENEDRERIRKMLAE